MQTGGKRVFFFNRAGAHRSGLTYPTLQGEDIPNGKYQGMSGQHYFRYTGDVWINVNGAYRWVKIAEA